MGQIFTHQNAEHANPVSICLEKISSENKIINPTRVPNEEIKALIRSSQSTVDSCKHLFAFFVSANVCVYGKDFNAGDGSAQLRPMADTAWTPALQPRSEKFLLASNPDPTDPCRFKLEITMKEVNGVPVLANAIFRFGVSELDNPNRFPRNVKFGGNGVFGKLRGDGVSILKPAYPVNKKKFYVIYK